MEGRVVPSYFPSTTNGIHIIEDQLPGGLSNAMIQFVATHTDGTQKETLATTNQFRAINPNYTVLQYQLGTSNSPFDYIINNQWASDWSYVNQQESWFAHQSDSGEPQSAADLASGRVGNSTGLDLADISNPAWQQYTLNQVLQNMAATGSNGWFADSFTFGISGGGIDSPVPTRYQGTNAANPADWPGGVTWTTQLGNWAQTIENAFAQYNAANGTNYKFIPNLDARVTSWEPNWYDNSSGVPIVDGAFLEGFGEYTDTYDWTLSMNRGLNLTDNGKIVIMQPYPSSDPNTAAGQQQVNFYLGTYLLLKGDQTYLNIDYGGGVQYYPQYELNLGTATTPLATNVSSYLWNGVYRRDFQNGFVLVNPGSTTYNLNLGGTYREMQATGGGSMTDAQLDANGNYIGGSLSYQNVSSISMAGGTAAIFLYPTGGPTVQTPAAASANPVTGTTVGLSVLGQENGSDSGLTYTWSSSGPAGVTFSANGTNAAKNATATFAKAGAYTFTATISDGSQSVTSSVNVTVSQTLTSIQVSPSAATVADGATQQFGASGLDQFGTALATQPSFTWSVDSGGLGAINGTGLYTAPASGVGSATVRATSGTVNSAAAVSVVASSAATFVKADTATAGSWKGVYGSQGYDVVGGSLSLPSYATVSLAGQQNWTWAASTSDTRALQSGGSGRVAACWYSGGSFTVSLNLTDGAQHQLALYLLDWDKQGRSEQVQLINSATGAVLDSRTVSGFTGGEYLVWDVTGNVQIKVTHVSGPNAVLSGLFLDPVTTAAPLAQVYDGTTAIADGTGSDAFGSTTAGKPVSKTFTVKNAGTAPLTLGPSITLPAGFALAAGFGSTTLAAGASTTFTVKMSAAAAGSYSGKVSFATNDTANNPFTFTVSGTVTAAGSSSATFVKADTATGGSWKGVYGSQGYDIAGGSLSLPSYATVSLSGQQNWTWAASTSDTRALQNGSGRLAATWYSATSFTVNVNLTDGATHQLALYVVDWDKQGRSEQIQLINPATGAVLDSRTVSGFSGGEYLVWDVSGSVQIKVTDLAGPNAVLSGLFID